MGFDAPKRLIEMGLIYQYLFCTPMLYKKGRKRKVKVRVSIGNAKNENKLEHF